MEKITVAEYARREGISKQAAYKRIKSKGLPIENGLLTVDSSVETVEINQPNTVNSSTTVVQPNKPLDNTGDSALYTALSDTVALLTAQLEVKDRQIEELNQRLKELNNQLTTALNQTTAAQALQAGTIQQALEAAPKKRRRWFWNK